MKSARFGVGLVLVVSGLAAWGCTRDPVVAAAQHVEKADGYAAQARHEEAIIEYGRALQLNPHVADVRYKLARIYEATGEAAKAHRELVQVADLDATNVEAQMTVGKALLASGDWEGARRRAEAAITAAPGHAPAHVLLGNALANLRDTESALAQIQQALSIDPTSAVAWTSLGAVHFLKQQGPQARHAFERAVTAAPESVDARLSLAHFEWASGDVAAAEAHMKRGVELNRSNAGTHRALALFYLATGRAADAEPHLRAVAVDAVGQLHLAEYLGSMGRYSAAHEVLSSLAAQPDKGIARAARLREAELLHASGNRRDAHDRLDRLLNEDGRDPELRLAKARLLLVDGAPSAEVSLHAREALKSDALVPEAQYVLGAAAIVEGDLVSAERAFEEVLRLNPRAAAAHMQLAQIHLSTGATRKAVAAAERAIKEQPGETAASALLVKSLRAHGEDERAAAEVRRGLAEGADPSLLVQQGWLAMKKREARAAHTAFQQAQQLEPSSYDARAGMVAAVLDQRRFDEARRLVNEWRRANASDARADLLAGHVELAAGRPEAAVLELSKVTRTPPASGTVQVQARELLARIYVAQGQTTQAVAEYEALAADSPRSAADARTSIGVLHDTRQEVDQARAAYERALAGDPKAGIAANNLAWIYAREGRLQEALQLATVANDVLGRRAETQHTLGWIYYQMGLTPQAVAALDSARHLAPSKALYQYHAALAHLRSGDHARAKTAFEKALALDSNFEGVADAKTQLAALAQ